MHISAFLFFIFTLPGFSATLAPPVAHSCADCAITFAADSSIDVQRIFQAAKAAQGNVLDTYPSSPQSDDNVKIFGDWLNLDDVAGVSAIHFIADMDVDCDGVDFQCAHNPDGQPQTSFGHLAATQVPYFVLPLRFYQNHSWFIKPNSLGAIVCNGRMFYGIFGDEDGDTPQVIGEASILMAQTCFPDDGLDGGTGHEQLDVLYVVFGQKVPTGVGDVTIDIQALKSLGDQQVIKLAYALGAL